MEEIISESEPPVKQGNDHISINVGTSLDHAQPLPNHNNDDAVRRLANSINIELEGLAPQSDVEPCIFRVPKHVRQGNEKAYTPREVSIGPLHYGRQDLQPREKFKSYCLKQFRTRLKGTLDECIQLIKSNEDKCRSCYSDRIEVDSDEFVKMMLVDSSFILEFLMFVRNSNEGRGGLRWNQINLRALADDMLLIENQIPFFLLEALFKEASSNSTDSLIDLSIGFLVRCIWPNLEDNATAKEGKAEFIKDRTGPGVKHLVDLLRTCHLPTLLRPRPPYSPPYLPTSPRSSHVPMYCRAYQETSGMKYFPTCCSGVMVSGVNPFVDLLRAMGSGVKHLVDLRRACHLPAFLGPQPKILNKMFFINRNATALSEAGVKFGTNSHDHLLDISFNNGLLEIPILFISGSTELLFRNMVALEQKCYTEDSYIIDYLVFLDMLVDTSKDVDLLVQSEILDNGSESSPVTANFLDNVTRNTMIITDDYYYKKISEDLEKYCNIPHNRWRATLLRDYFSTPWRIASTIAAVVLLVLTFVQTVCSVMSV